MEAVTLITGATGFVGRRLVGPDCRLLVRKITTDNAPALGDLLNPRSLADACEGIECVLHCAGYAHAFGTSDADMHWKVNYEGTRNLARAAGEAGVKRFIFLSSVKAMASPGQHCVDEDWPGVPTTPYGKAKRAAEDAVLEAGQKYGMHVVNLRLSMVYGAGGRGNLERLARGLQAGWFPLLPETHNARSLVHVDDVVSAVRLASVHPLANGRTYIVADPRPYSGRQLCEEIISVLPRPGFSWSAPAWAFRLGGKVGDLGGAILRRPLSLNTEVVARLLDSECYSPARIHKELGWQAQVSLRTGLTEMLLQKPEKT